MKNPRTVTLAALLVLAPALPAAAAGDGLAQCAAIDASAARLACYDALAGRAPATTVAAAKPAAAPTPAPAVAPPAAPAANDPQHFGLAQVQVHTAPEEPKSIEAHVAQVIDNGVTRPSVVLDNGQTWIFTEAADDAALRPGDPVTIKRAALGSFLLVTPAKHSYHVHRTR